LSGSPRNPPVQPGRLFDESLHGRPASRAKDFINGFLRSGSLFVDCLLLRCIEE